MYPVRPVPHAAPFIEEVTKISCVQRTWNAVVHFFTMIAQYITDAINAAWSCLRNVFCPVTPTPPIAEPAPVIVAPPIIAPAIGTLGEKLALYRNMPRDNVNFVQRSVDAFTDVLERKEQANIAALNDQRPLQVFNDNFMDMTSLVDVAHATVRGYVFSDSTANGTILTFFNQVAGQKEGEYNDPVRDPTTGELLYLGGYQMINEYKDHTEELRELRALFNGLPDHEKEIILDKTDFADSDQLAVSENGKKVLKGIARISNRLIQTNAPFMAALQAVYQRKFSPAAAN